MNFGHTLSHVCFFGTLLIGGTVLAVEQKAKLPLINDLAPMVNDISLPVRDSAGFAKVKIDAKKEAMVKPPETKPEVKAEERRVEKELDDITEVADSKRPPHKDVSPQVGYTLGQIDGEADDATTVVNIRFDKKLDWKNVEIEDHGNFIQIALPKTLIPEPGKFYDIKSSYITKVSSFQTTQQNGAVRLFLNRQASELKDALHADVLNDRIVVTLDQVLLEKKGIFDHVPKTATALATASAPAVSAKDIIAKTEVKSDIADPAALSKKSESATILADDSAGALGRKVKIVAIISALIFMTLVAVTFVKGLMLRLKSPASFEDAFVMKTIATQNLAPKHKIMLIQVGNEKILLGVSPDGIRYLANVGGKEPKNNHSGPEFLLEESISARPQIKKQLPIGGGAIRRPDQVASYSRAAAAGAVRERAEKFPTMQQGAARSKRINTVIGDQGVHDLNADWDEGSSEPPAKTIEDVTSLIRRKIKNMPNI